MKRARILMAVAIIGVFLFGCADGGGDSSFAPIQNSIFVDRDGGFSSALVESYDKDYYDQTELQQFLQKAVAEFNGSETPEGEKAPVVLVSCSLEDGVASSVFEYGSGEDLVRFARESGDDSNTFTFLDTTTVADGIVKGYLMDGRFVNTKGEAVATDQVTKQSKYHVVCAQGAGTVQTEGKIAFMSEGVTLVDEYTASTPEEGRSYIIFK